MSLRPSDMMIMLDKKEPILESDIIKHQKIAIGTLENIKLNNEKQIKKVDTFLKELTAHGINPKYWLRDRKKIMAEAWELLNGR